MPPPLSEEEQQSVLCRLHEYKQQFWGSRGVTEDYARSANDYFRTLEKAIEYMSQEMRIQVAECCLSIIVHAQEELTRRRPVYSDNCPLKRNIDCATQVVMEMIQKPIPSTIPTETSQVEISSEQNG